jgi:hypothetical protein
MASEYSNWRTAVGRPPKKPSFLVSKRLLFGSKGLILGQKAGKIGGLMLLIG